ncbi:MAG: phospho-N-acetylmuramoyl-pentapeptide-transferase [Armatimonadota bacterium]|nr:phospho-N-acetylmuramoyl-pentapeptide-transferase [bacterium]MDW8319791.1 phospho-N-acetylmuramoyl-pentapeptide-transferase [Armatimonadota bacterium]
MLWFWVAFVIALITVLAMGEPTLRALVAVKAGQAIREDAPERHRSKAGTPTMGGVLIVTGLVIGVLLTLGAQAALSQQTLTRAWDPAVFCTTVLAFAGIGLLDDYLIIRRGKNLGLKARQKLLMQCAVATVFVVYLALNAEPGVTTVFQVGEWRLDAGIWYYPLAVLFIVALSNAVNLADGLDGLAAGLSLIAASALGSISSLREASWVLQGAGALGGACAGFLHFNRYPARVFMGDTGSLGLGAALALIALYAKVELVALVVLLVFWIEMLSVILQVISFQTTGKRIFRMSPLHHHFELLGMHETRVVTMFWIAGILSAAAGYLIAWANT